MIKKCHDSKLAIKRHEFSHGDTCSGHHHRIDQLLLGIPVIPEPGQRLDLVNLVVNLQIGRQ